ncbi:MAG: PIG-L family deacetylase [Acidobacteria bacterium]|nr:PIG-L family deacetylase [Acidobacteriota bacterium]
MNILVISAHPDDEMLGLGGTLARHAQEGASVFPVIFADGSQVRYDENQRQTLQMSCIRSCAELGLQEPRFLGFPDQKLDTYPQITLTQAIEDAIAQHQPEVVYTHHVGDMNRDHQVLHEATLVATRPKPGGPVRRLLAYTVPSSTDWAPCTASRSFLPNWFVDISATIGQKLRALSHYSSEVPPYPHPRSLEAIENQAKYWGSGVGYLYAEPFMLVRNLIGTDAGK